MRCMSAASGRFASSDGGRIAVLQTPTLSVECKGRSMETDHLRQIVG